MLKRNICPCEVLISSAISVLINTEIYHLIQGKKPKTKQNCEFRLPLKFKSSLLVVVI